MSGLYDLSLARAAEIVAAAMANGEGFVPKGGQMAAIVLQPVDCSQVIIIEIPVPYSMCGTETAWGVVDGRCGLIDGANEFPGKNWAEFIPYDCMMP